MRDLVQLVVSCLETNGSSTGNFFLLIVIPKSTPSPRKFKLKEKA